MSQLHSYLRNGVGLVATIAAVVGFTKIVPDVAVVNTPDVARTVRSNTADSSALYTVHDTTIDAFVDGTGTAAPIQQATLSTRLMGSVVNVLVREGDHVTAGQLLLSIDARDLAAKLAQAAASNTQAEAVARDAQTQAARIRALYADSAATRAQLDVAETGLTRARAGVEAASAAMSELHAVSSYAEIRAPFAGVVTRRFVDPGAFATPGAPLLSVQDASTLRISVTTTPEIARSLARGQRLLARVEHVTARATLEGIVPTAGNSLYTVNAIVANRDHALMAGSRVSLALPTARHDVLVVPLDAVVRVGDLTGVTLRTAQGDDRRWVRLGRTIGTMIEVTAGLEKGDCIVLSGVLKLTGSAP